MLMRKICVTSISLQSRLNSTSSRKLLFPLMKTLHPDMFAQESVEVQNQNSACIQNINGLWECVDSFLDAMVKAKTENRPNFDINNPFLPSYEFLCYVRQEEKQSSSSISSTNNDDTVQLIKRKLVLNVPPKLCQKQSISLESAKEDVHSIFVQQGQLFIAVGLEDPWAKLRSEFQHRQQRKQQKVSSAFEREMGLDNGMNGVLSDELNQLLFDRLVIRNTRLAMNGDCANMSRMLGETFGTLGAGRFGKHGSKNPGSCPEAWMRKRDQRILSEQVDKYLNSGRVRVQGLKDEAELEALSRFKDFLLEYGPLVNFAPDTWGRVVVVMLPAYKRRRKKSSASSVPNTEEWAVAPDLKVKDGLSYEFIANHHVLKVPCNFRVSQLLSYLGENLPVASLDYTF